MNSVHTWFRISQAALGAAALAAISCTSEAPSTTPSAVGAAGVTAGAPQGNPAGNTSTQPPPTAAAGRTATAGSTATPPSSAAGSVAPGAAAGAPGASSTPAAGNAASGGSAGADTATAGAGTAAGAGGATAPAPSTVTCPSTAKAPGDHNGSVQFGGHQRTYLLHVPASYTGREPIPLVFDFHGYGQSVTSQMGASGFAQLADKHNFATVYPAGVGGSWHVNGCCGQAASEKLDEIGAVREVLKQISSEVCIDPKRIYASGISQGGGMAHHVACLASDIFAAVAPVSSDLRTDPCTPSRPVSELSFRGTADTLSAYEGGPVGPAGMQYQSIGAKATLEKWRMIDECTGTPEAHHEFCETYKQCAGGVEVTLCSIPGGGHALYRNPANFSLAELAWEMFERQRLP